MVRLFGTSLNSTFIEKEKSACPFEMLLIVSATVQSIVVCKHCKQNIFLTHVATS